MSLFRCDRFGFVKFSGAVVGVFSCFCAGAGCRSASTEVIIFAAGDGQPGAKHLWMIDATGKPASLTRLTDGPVVDEQPRVSPDGRWLAFSRTRGLGDDPHHIWVRSLSTGGETEITPDAGAEQNDAAPFWHPSGTDLGFWRDRRAVPGTGRLWKVGLVISNGRIQAAGPPTQLSPTAGLSRLWGSWNPATGADIVFANEVGGFNPFTIWRLDSSGRETEILPHGCCGNLRPHYSPDGRRIAYVSYQQSEAGDIHVVNADGTGVARVTCRSGWMDLDWSPDGRDLVVVPSKGPASGVWRISAPASGGACSDPVQVAPLALRASAPTWARITGRL